MIFQTRSFWMKMRVPSRMLQNKLKEYFGEEVRCIEDRKEATNFLRTISDKIQKKLSNRMKTESSYGMLLKLYFIFGEVHSMYLEEKEARLKLVEHNIYLGSIDNSFITNRNIERHIIDACNIWIENCVLFEHDVELKSLNIKKEFVMDYELLIDLYVYGFVSQAISLLMLSKKIGEKNTFYGLNITLKTEMPAEVLKYHPVIYFNTMIVGNQHDLVNIPLTAKANDTEFGQGFYDETKVEFLLFLAVLHSFQKDKLKGDDKSITIITKEQFIELVNVYTTPPVSGQSFYNRFVLNKDKIKYHLRKGEDIIWIIGANKYRHELCPFIEMSDGNILINYGAIEQAKQLWISYFSNGGMCYTNPNDNDSLQQSMEKRNKELSENILVDRLREILNEHYHATVDLKDVDYRCIFGEKDKNYGDYDIVFFCDQTKELFLIESKYFSDSLNSSGLVNDYNKMFGDNGYYKHCRERYNLVIDEPEKVKAFIQTTDEVYVHMLFISSKPIEMEFQDDDEVVTFLSLNLFEKYLDGNLISDDGSSVVRKVRKL